MQNAKSFVKVHEDKYSMGKFRGHWNATNVAPAFNAYQILPTPPAMKPRVREAVATEEHGIFTFCNGSLRSNLM